MSDKPFIAVHLEDGIKIPTRSHPEDAGLDIYSPESFTIKKGRSVVIDTGVHIELPPNTVGMIKSRSGMNVRQGLVCEGVIDSGYTGSIKIKIYNHSQSDQLITEGDRIAQLVILPCIICDLYETGKLDQDAARGDKGIGSTGK